MRRKESLVTGEIYHVFNKSIAGFRLLNDSKDFVRIRQLLQYYRFRGMPRFSEFMDSTETRERGFLECLNAACQDRETIVQIIAYCAMPTHLHLVLKQLKDDGISIFMGNLLNSYTRYFNLRHRRKGPLWESRFKSVRVESDEQLLHLTRYVHLNPVTAHLVEKPEEWEGSSYREYLSDFNGGQGISSYADILEIDPEEYRRFVTDQIGYQRELAQIKHLVVD